MSEQDAVPAKAGARKIDADREAALAAGKVKCRVLPLGDEQIHTGETEIVDGRERAKTFGRGEHFWVAKSIGVAQERAGRVEIVEGL